MTVKCTNCNKEQEYNEEKRFCEMCGTKLPQTKQCIKCNKELPLEANFCSFCGTNQSEAINKSQSTGFHMGSDNMIAGDFTVVGKKEETHIAGNATIVKNEDETKHVKVCHICGSHKTVLEGHDCPECKKFTCNSCFNKEYKMCNGCATKKISENEKAYKEKLVQFLKDGIIDKNERKELDDLKQKYNISNETALMLENSLKKNINIETLLTTIEKSNLENSYEIFYEEGDVVEAYNLLKPLYDKYPNEEKVLEIFLPVLLKKDINEAKKVVTNSSIDSLSVFLLKTQIALEENRLDEAERNLLQAKKYANNNVVKYFEVLLNILLASEIEDLKFLDKAHEIIDTMEETENKLEASYKVKASIDLRNMEEDTFYYFTKPYCIEHNLYKTLLLEPVEVTVGIGCDYETIQSAIDNVCAGSVINVQPGIYKENLIVNENVKIIGITENIREKTSKELPIVVSDKEIGCKIESNAKIEGIVFTNNENIVFDTVDEYVLSEKEYNDENIKHVCLIVTSEAVITNIAVIDCSGMGIQVYSCNPHIKNIMVRDSNVGICIQDYTTGLYEGCEINSCNVGMCVIANANPHILGCKIHDIEDSGICIFHEATGTYEDCDIFEIDNKGIDVSEKANPHIIGCKIHDIENIGIGIIEDATGTYKDCDISKIGGTSIYVGNKANPHVLSCKIHDNANSSGIFISGEATGIYEDCDISQTGKGSISVLGKANPHILGCKIHDIVDSGICIIEEATGIYENCDIFEIGGDGISVFANANPHIIGCKIHDISDSNGIFISEEATGTYEDCDISEIDNIGIDVSEKANPHVLGCKIHDIVGSGIYISEEATGTYEDCDISNTGASSIFVDNKANPHVLNCKIHNISEWQGIYIREEATGTFEKCDISKTGRPGIVAVKKANPYVLSCKIHDISDSNGIYITEEATGTFEKCDISKTGKASIVAVNKANPHVLNCKIHDNSNTSGIFILEEATGTYENCEIFNTKDGISVYDKAKPYVISCNIHKVKDFGILLTDKVGGIYRDCSFYDVRTHIYKATWRTKIINCGK